MVDDFLKTVLSLAFILGLLVVTMVKSQMLVVLGFFVMILSPSRSP